MSDDTHIGISGRLGAENLQEFLTFRIARVHAHLNAQASHLLNKHAGLSLVQWRIIVTVANLGSTTSNNICRVTGMDKGLVSRKLKDLVRDQIVHSETSETDSRQHILTLTARGRTAHDRVLPIMRRRQKHLLDQLNSDEVDVLAAALVKIDGGAARLDFDD